MTDPLARYRIAAEPYYQPVADELRLFDAAYAMRLPLMLKGPTGCGKSRFVQYMAWRLGKPLITVACNEDLTAGDLVGRWLLDADGTRWQDGPLTQAARHGAICYLDEVVEARADTTVVIHPLTDTRRMLPIEKRDEVVAAHADFHLVVSYNPGYQAAAKDLKTSTRQRFSAIEFDFPKADLETRIVAHESGLPSSDASTVVALGERTRRLKGHGLEEGASTRMLVHAASLMARGIDAQVACRMAVVLPLTDDPDLAQALSAAVAASF
ncbi:CbbQ/NirQ/NorQ/GpvN family protein [Xylophilus sp. GOD-11R]|uniref:CbbQ/NirQ/NorQ/GpvN family protein n=1 Tax=Xylophilus sp. GOD-11R TaxID=3089814 RepID=UPI00298BF2BF|nr:CbbQ/NirQ/NorQ/GpvN family protein [Xylophilus sp. GOD-11R]WPB57428.1 CbbQ/NirQ/NorQ/GpvN family protein [Xylophilus sp. GOD-11R]